VQLLLDAGQPLAQFTRSTLQQAGLTALELLTNRVFGALRRQRRFDVAGNCLALAAKHVGAGALQRPLPKLLLILDPNFDEQLTAAVFLPPDRFLVFALADAEASPLTTNRLASLDERRLPGGGFGKLVQLVQQRNCTKRDAGIGGKLDDPRGERIQFGLPPGELLAALR
jgi:hypothetical protein